MKDNSTAQLVDDLRAALNWCVSNSGECLGDHPDRLKRFDALIDETRGIDLARAPVSQDAAQLVERLLEEFDGWEQAYPLSVFPEPDLKMAAALLKAGGMTLDAVSASNMRHVVSRLAPRVRETIEALTRVQPSSGLDMGAQQADGQCHA